MGQVLDITVPHLRPLSLLLPAITALFSVHTRHWQRPHIENPY
jgi:hypothetical protein